MAGPTYGKNPPSDQVDFGIVAGQHWRSWEEICEQFAWADESGWDSAWGFDHIFSLRDGELGPCMEGWTMLSALAVKTSNVQIGLLVASTTHRHPSLFAKEAATVDVISGGRLILGMGAGWQEREHKAYGIPFPSPRERVDRFGEALEIYRRLESQERATFQGRYYSLDEAPFEPKPVYGHVPILVGSRGARMMRHIARFADIWDGRGTPEEYRALGERLNQRCREIGRDPSEIRWAINVGPSFIQSEDTFRQHVRDYAAVGVRMFLFDIPTGSPTRTMRTIAERVIPDLRLELNGRE